MRTANADDAGVSHEAALVTAHEVFESHGGARQTAKGDYHIHMTVTMDSLSRQALVLPPAQRLILACSLIESVESDDAPCPDAAWDTEIRDRIARFDRGETKGIAAADVFRKLREIAPGR